MVRHDDHTIQLTEPQLEELVVEYLRQKGYGGFVDSLHDPKHPEAKVLNFLTDTIEEVSIVAAMLGGLPPEETDAPGE